MVSKLYSVFLNSLSDFLGTGIGWAEVQAGPEKGEALAADAKQRAKRAKLDGYRIAIVESSEVLFARQGAHATKVAEVAGEAGISLATLYAVFPGGKSEIVAAIHATRAGEFVSRARESAARPGTADARLAEGMRQAVLLGIEHAHYTRMQLAEGFSWALPNVIGEHVPGGRMLFEAGLEPLAEMIGDGVDEGVFVAEDVDRAARAASLLLQLHLAEWLEAGETETTEEVFVRLWRELRRLLDCRD